MTERDETLAELERAYRTLVDAGGAYLAGDLARAIGEIDEVVIGLRDIAADLRRAASSHVEKQEPERPA